MDPITRDSGIVMASQRTSEDGDADLRLLHSKSHPGPFRQASSRSDSGVQSQLVLRPNGPIQATTGQSPPSYELVPIKEKTRPRYTVSPREEEGRERLPGYSCSVTAEGVFQKKMELDTPFERSEIRAWSDVYVVLKGTMLNIHQVKKRGFFATKKSTAGTVDSPDNYPGAMPGALIRSYTLQNAEVGIAADYRKYEFIPRAVLLRLLRYGSPADRRLYRERCHFVIRLRCETDQFLLSCRTVETFIRWLEDLSAAIDLAPPLEDRTLPRYRTIPRRRQRNQEQIRREQELIIQRHYPQLLARSAERETPSRRIGLRSISVIETPNGLSGIGSTSDNNAAVTRSLTDRRKTARRRSLDETTASRVASRTVKALSMSFTQSDRAAVEVSIQGGLETAVEEPGEGGDEITPAFRRPIVRRASASQESIDLTDLREASAALGQDPSGQGAPQGICDVEDRMASSQSEEGGKWRPLHNWNHARQIRYARRCMANLHGDAPRRSDIIITEGKRWRIRWDIGALIPLESDLLPDYDSVVSKRPTTLKQAQSNRYSFVSTAFRL